jgi:type IV secretory pathway VirB6-like protein
VVEGVVRRNHGMAVRLNIYTVTDAKKINWAGYAYLYSQPVRLAGIVQWNFVCLQIIVHVIFMHIIKCALERSRLKDGLLYFILLQSTELLDATKCWVM